MFHRVLAVISLGLLALTPVLSEEIAVAHVKSIIITPHKVDDDGNGVDLLVQVELLEEAPAAGTLKLTIVPDSDQPGEARWKDDKEEQSFHYRAKDQKLEVRAHIRIVRNGRIAVKAETTSDQDTEDCYYWMDGTIRK